MATNYNPSDYIKDFSWIGEAGNRFAKVAEKFPSLMELNRAIREDRALKQKAQDTFVKYFQEFDDNDMYVLAQQMKLNPENAQDAKQKIIDRMPSYNDKTPTTDYIKQLANDFLNPMIKAGKNYQDATGKDTFSVTNLLGPLYGTELGTAGSMTQSAQEQNALALEKDKADVRGQVQQKFKIEDEERAVTNEKKQGLVDSTVVDKLIANAGVDPMAVFVDSFDGAGNKIEATLPQKKAAYEFILKSNAQKLDAEGRRLSRTPKPKEMTPAQIDARKNSTISLIGVYEAKMKKDLEDNNNKPSTEYKRMSDILGKLYDNLEIWQNTATQAAKTDATNLEDINRIRAQEELKQKANIVEKADNLTKKMESGKFGGWTLNPFTLFGQASKGDDRRRFEKELKEKIPGATVTWEKDKPTIVRYGEDITNVVAKQVKAGLASGSSIRKNSENDSNKIAAAKQILANADRLPPEKVQEAKDYLASVGITQ